MFGHDLRDKLVIAEIVRQACVVRAFRSVVALLGLSKEGDETGNFLNGGQEFTADQVQFHILEKEPSVAKQAKTYKVYCIAFLIHLS